jgi:glycosyltransferase involved in cell wall biosynthesis
VTSLRVGVNLLWLVPGVVGGSEEYTTRLITALLDDPPDDIELTLFVVRPFVDEYAELVDRVPTVVCPVTGRNKGLRIAAEATWLAYEARRRNIDLMHHAAGTLPLLRATPSIVTIHDLQPLLLPQNFSRVKQAYLRLRQAPSARRARLVLTLTEYTRRTIVDVLGVPPDHVLLVPPGYTAAIEETPEGDPASTYDITGPFFLYPAITYVHKNHATLVRAFARVLEKRHDALLVLTHRGDEAEDTVQQLIDALGVRPNVRRLGHIARGDLDWLYRNATALTFPSRFEGFGLPVLEAMGHGCPVIAADATALPEVVGDAGVLVGADDVDGWAAAMTDLLTDDRRREWLREASLAQVARFRWSASAAALADAYRKGGAGLR